MFSWRFRAIVIEGQGYSWIRDYKAASSAVGFKRRGNWLDFASGSFPISTFDGDMFHIC
ncbi:hypothetical protein K493DRAFT_319046 [Basidiobolus meristosporus CBS 931.73]|uniref:Uncharacterized protein n=1 Tax=Basidiobolus meristosporus CBS 931.73 TaxID=1314790 RepID=A0A1Y1XTE9_9FUNG|nr:hypothetical protein K493DRAFT_319046 [Basidiobolus meristosporus CBS 931.73]|eukprot:ORX89008.1 hypothetical protein K493DRAFT_319046 [Basidiobolus meristosporus CBS 931.73]